MSIMPFGPMWGQPKRTAVSGPSPTGELLYQSFFAPPSGVFAFTRASNAWGFDSTGTLTQAASDISRQVYDPATLTPLGTLLEPTSTNQIRNPRCESAAAGTPGTPPTYWNLLTSAGIASQIVGNGIEAGIPCIDVRFFGTTTATAAAQVRFETNTAIAALTGQIWSGSAFFRLVAGSFGSPSVGPFLQMVETTSTGAQVISGAVSFIPTDAPLNTQRVIYTRTLSGGATVASVFLLFNAGYNGDTVVDFTLRIGLPQMEQAAYASSPIMPPAGSPAASTRAADNLTLALPYAGFPGPTGWTAMLEFVPLAQLSSKVLMAVFGAGPSNANATWISTSSTQTNPVGAKRVASGTTAVTPNTTGTLAVGSVAKAAIGNDTSGISLALNGTPTVSAVSAGYPDMLMLSIGFDRWEDDPVARFPMHARRLRFWSSKLSDAELQAMTT